MGIIAKPYTFSPNTTVSSSQVNSDFDTVYNELNGNIAAANLAADSVVTAKIADSNVTTAKIADANVTSAKLAMQAWASWTPTWTNLTVGNGTNASVYIQFGKTVFCYVSFTLGSTSSVGNGAYFTLPVTSKTLTANASLGLLTFGAYQGAAGWRSTTTAILLCPASSGNGILNQNTTSSVPFSWTTGSTIIGYFMYEAA